MTRSAPRGWWLLIEVGPVLAVAFATFHGLRSGIADYYHVPSQSMAPTLHGHPERGDVVLVDKSAWWFARPERWDMVVVRGATAGSNFIVKRMVAVGPVDLRIDAGDVYSAAPGGGAMQRLVKDPLTHADLRVPVFQHPPPGPDAESLTDFWHFPPTGFHLGRGSAVLLDPAAAALGPFLPRLDGAARRQRRDAGALRPSFAGLVSSRDSIDTSYLDPMGRREWRGFNVYPDIGVELEVVAPPELAAWVFVLEYRHRDCALTWEPGRCRVWIDGVSPDEFDFPVALAPGAASRLAFGYLDGRVFLVADGQAILCTPVDLAVDRDLPATNGLHFGCVGAAVQIDRIRAFRDLSFSTVGGRQGRDDGRYRVEAGQMFLLGDNTNDSTDSRIDGPVACDRLVGRPIAILAPFARAGMLVR